MHEQETEKYRGEKECKDPLGIERNLRRILPLLSHAMLATGPGQTGERERLSTVVTHTCNSMLSFNPPSSSRKKEATAYSATLTTPAHD
jgi:hypothetical protein